MTNETKLDHADRSPTTFVPGEVRGGARGLLRLDSGWFHLSQLYPTLKLRPLNDDEVDETRVEEFRLSDPKVVEQLRTRFVGAQYYSGWSRGEAIVTRDRQLIVFVFEL